MDIDEREARLKRLQYTALAFIALAVVISFTACGPLPTDVDLRPSAVEEELEHPKDECFPQTACDGWEELIFPTYVGACPITPAPAPVGPARVSSCG